MSALQQARKDLGWSQARAIAELERCARAAGVSLPSSSSLKTELSRWENGHRTPDAFYQRLFERAYGRSSTELGISPVDDDSPVVLGGNWEDSVMSAADFWKRDLDRREFLRSSAFAATAFAAPTLHALVGSSTAAPSRAAGTVAVGAPQLTFIRDMTQHLASLDNRYGGGQVRRAAVAFLDGEVAPLLTQGRFSASVGRSLTREAAELARLVGWMTHDVGRHALAQQYLIQSLHLANTAGDQALAAEVLAAMSQQATYMNEAREAVDLARGARTLAQREGLSALVAETALMEAHGHAKAGESAACAAALSAAETALDQADRTSDPHWIGYFDEAYLSAKFGHCFRELGDHEHAVQFAERSLHMSDGYDRGRVFNLTLLAHSHAQAGHFDEACVVGQQAATAAAGMRSDRVVRHLRDFREAVGPATGSAGVAALDAALGPVLSAA